MELKVFQRKLESYETRAKAWGLKYVPRGQSCKFSNTKLCKLKQSQPQNSFPANDPNNCLIKCCLSTRLIQKFFFFLSSLCFYDVKCSKKAEMMSCKFLYLLKQKRSLTTRVPSHTNNNVLIQFSRYIHSLKEIKKISFIFLF